jgi:hypothetical protein
MAVFPHCGVVCVLSVCSNEPLSLSSVPPPTAVKPLSSNKCVIDLTNDNQPSTTYVFTGPVILNTAVPSISSAVPSATSAVPSNGVITSINATGDTVHQLLDYVPCPHHPNGHSSNPTECSNVLRFEDDKLIVGAAVLPVVKEILHRFAIQRNQEYKLTKQNMELAMKQQRKEQRERQRMRDEIDRLKQLVRSSESAAPPAYETSQT